MMEPTLRSDSSNSGRKGAPMHLARGMIKPSVIPGGRSSAVAEHTPVDDTAGESLDELS